MKPLTELSGIVTVLPRGGYLVDTSIGYIQFGSPPETIKDTLLLPNGVPQIFVLPRKMFNWVKGISIAEIEFPLYYNFFIKKKKTLIICSDTQYRQLKKVLQESIFGPEEIDIANDFNLFDEDIFIPDIIGEMKYFRKGLKFSDILSIGLFRDNIFSYKGITIRCEGKENFSVFNGDNKLADVPGSIDYQPTYIVGERLAEPYMPPLFGVTCLGPSHGFDPEENTSGFIIWLNHAGTMVDPPVNSTEWLKDSNVNPKLINKVILTHCHADHDAGTFQKILEEGRITLYTTETILESFLRKYAALSNRPEDDLRKLFNFHPVKIGKPLFIHGGKFNFFYTIHSIPTIGFKMEFQDQSFFYSSDHNNDPAIHKELLDLEIISPVRFDELQNIAWDCNVIYHESGVPPLHTPINYLNSLPRKLQKRIVVYHIARKDFPDDTNLTLAKFGIEHTLYFKTTTPKFEKAYQILGLLGNIDFFEDLNIGKAQDFIDIVVEEKFKKGEKIINKGTRGDKFFIIFSGNVSIDSGGLEEKKIYGSYDYFGEVAIITEQNRAADVIAETDVVLYTVERDKFLNFITNTEFEKILHRLAKIRNSETWNLLSMSSVFRHCTATQKTWLESIFNPVELKEPGIIINEGSIVDSVYIIRSGKINVSKKGCEVAHINRGELVGSMQNLYDGVPELYTFANNESVSLFRLMKDDVIKLIDKNPGILMKMDYRY